VTNVSFADSSYTHFESPLVCPYSQGVSNYIDTG